MSLVVFLVVWQLSAACLAKPFFPLPSHVALEFAELITSGELTAHFLISALRVLLSLVLSFVLAVPLGFLLGNISFLDRMLSPLVYLLYPLPKIVFLPLIVITCGLGNLPKILMISLVVFFQVLVSTRDAVKDLSPQWIIAMKSLHATNWQIYYHLIWPACLPRIFTALRISIGSAVAVLFLAETFVCLDGLGCFILNTMEQREFEQMYSGIMAMGFLGIIFYFLVDFLQGIFCRWNKL